MKLLLIFAVLFSLYGCKETHFRKEKFFAGNVVASADVLNLGKSTYEEYCFACHGLNGNGKGVASKGLYPPVRNFIPGIFKFGEVKDGELPHDEELKRLIRNGLPGTPMLPWDISDKRLHAVVQYIKTFAPEVWEGKDKTLGVKIVHDKDKDRYKGKEIAVLAADPYGKAHQRTAIEKGKLVYHFTAACTTCHRGYVDLQEYNNLAKAAGEDPIDELDEEFYKLKPQDSEYGAKIIPPDFTWHPIRSLIFVKEPNNPVSKMRSEKDIIHDLAIRIAAGVTGVMPTWKDSIADEEIWAVAYYVKSLMDLKDTKERKDFMMKLGSR